MKYIKQLDAIRAIAVLIVIVAHWVPEESKIRFLVNGQMGVNIFFVLSGFLITRILIYNKLQLATGAISNSSFFKVFYIRRTLRIFPIYYLTIFLLLIFHEGTGTNIKSNFIYFLTYTSNIYFHNIHSWDGIVSHLWSLAVEEQFYLIWPLVIFITPQKYLLPVIGMFILSGLLSQRLWHKDQFDNILVMNCFDAFGLGGLLSWTVIFKKEKLAGFYRIASIAGLLSALILAIQLFKIFPTPVFERTYHSLIALWVISYVVVNNGLNKEMRPGFILNNKVLIFLGRISYGIYLYHLILPTYWGNYLVALNNHFITPGTKPYLYLYYAENFILLVLFSWLSWKLVEQPILRLKKYFDYEKMLKKI